MRRKGPSAGKPFGSCVGGFQQGNGLDPRRAHLNAVVESRASVRERIGSLTANGTVSAEAEVALEILIAKAYGLQRDQFATLLQSFNKLASDEVDALVSKEFWS